MIMNIDMALVVVPFLVVAFLFASGMFIGSSVKKRHDRAFRDALTGLELEYASFYNMLYGFGIYRGLYISFKYSRVAKSDFVPMLPGSSSLMILCRVKVPGTEGRSLHLAVLPAGTAGSLRKLAGWLNPEPDVYFHAVRGQSTEETGTLFSLLSRGALEGMKRLAGHTASCAVSPDWESVMIGRDNALTLVKGDIQALSQLDLQVKIPLGISGNDLSAMLDEMAGAANLITRDLGRQ